MNQDKKDILLEQTKKLEEVISALMANFNNEDIADEVSFLKILRDNLKEWSEKA